MPELEPSRVTEERRKPSGQEMECVMNDRRNDNVTAEDYMPVRELNTHFQGIHDKLEDIHRQTKATNGRVGRLESWRDRMLGGLGVVIILIVPMLVYVLKLWVESRGIFDTSAFDAIISWVIGV